MSKAVKLSNDSYEKVCTLAQKHNTSMELALDLIVRTGYSRVCILDKRKATRALSKGPAKTAKEQAVSESADEDQVTAQVATRAPKAKSKPKALTKTQAKRTKVQDTVVANGEDTEDTAWMDTP